MTTNTYLNELLFPLCKSYRGCFSSDNIPPYENNGINTFIVNLSKQDEIGTHFVCLVIKPNVVYYFDSFGKKCGNEDILKYISNLDYKVYFNGLKIQHPKSLMCGFYCALVVLVNDERCNFKKDIKFSTQESSLLKNDSLCLSYIKRALKNWRTEA